jgi:hypothetical protein
MLHHRWQRHLERLREFAHRQIVPIGKARKERTPRRVGERRKGAVENGFGKLNHEVKCSRAIVDVKVTVLEVREKMREMRADP